MSNDFYQELYSIYRQCAEICGQYREIATITIAVKAPDGEEETLSVERVDDEDYEQRPTTLLD